MIEQPPDPAARASDSERDAIVARLADACVEGRLTLQEFTGRAGAAVAARTRDALTELVTDLPDTAGPRAPVAHRTRWLLALLGDSDRRGAWDVEDELKAVAVLGDVTIDLRAAHITSREIKIVARAVVKDVEVIVPAGVAVELTGVAVRGDIENTVPPITWGERERFTVRIEAHAVMGDVVVRRPDARAN